MTGYQIISDLQRVVRIEAESALADRPVRPERPRTPREPILAGARMGMTVALRRLADALEPAKACLDTPATAKGQHS